MSWWTFSDIFEEEGFPTVEFTNIYGLMTKSGIPKPGWRGFQLLAGAGDKRVPVTVKEHKGGDGVVDEEPHIATTAYQHSRSSSAESAAVGAPPPTCLQGGMQGGDIHVANMTIAAAAAWCTKDSKCGGFVATGQYPTSCSAASTVYEMHFKDTWGAAHPDADPMLTSWTVGSAPPSPSPPGPAPPSNVPLISAFATVNSTSTDVGAGAGAGGSGGRSPLLSTLRLYLGFWSVVASGIAPPANRTISVTVATTMSLPDLAAAAAAAAATTGGDGAVVDGVDGVDGVGVNSVATTATVWRIDSLNASPLAAWEAMGSPAVPSKEQLASLIAASVVHPEKVGATLTYNRETTVAHMDGDHMVEVAATLSVEMMPNAAVMVTF